MPLCLVKKKPTVYFNAICSTTVGTAVMESICASVRCAVQNTVGHLSERIIQSAIAAELRRSGIDVQEQVTIPVFNGTRIIGYNRIDMVLYLDDGPVVLELKRLRQSLYESPASARLRIMGQARAYGRCLARVSSDGETPECFVVNVFPQENAERVEIIPVACGPCVAPHKLVRSRCGRVLRRPDFYAEKACS